MSFYTSSKWEDDFCFAAGWLYLITQSTSTRRVLTPNASRSQMGCIGSQHVMFPFYSTTTSYYGRVVSHILMHRIE